METAIFLLSSPRAQTLGILQLRQIWGKNDINLETRERRRGCELLWIKPYLRKSCLAQTGWRRVDGKQEKMGHLLKLWWRWRLKDATDNWSLVFIVGGDDPQTELHHDSRRELIWSRWCCYSVATVLWNQDLLHNVAWPATADTSMCVWSGKANPSIWKI